MTRSALLSLRRLAPCLLALVTVLAWGGASRAAAQQPAPLAVSDTLYEVQLTDGGTYVGRIVAVEGETVTLESTAGVRVQFTRAQVVSIRPARGQEREGRFWRADPNQTRLFFSPTGRSLAAGDGYVGVYELFIPFVTFGITDQLLIAGGSPFYLAFTGEVTPPFYLGPKLQVVRTDRIQAGVGALAVWIPNTETLGIVYGVGTFGDADNAVTTGIGWGYVDGGFSSRPVVLLGGETRTGRSTKLITENLFVPGESGVLVSAGIRFFGERLSADAGLMGGIGGGDTECCLPVVNFVYHFGNARR